MDSKVWIVSGVAVPAVQLHFPRRNDPFANGINNYLSHFGIGKMLAPAAVAIHAMVGGRVEGWRSLQKGSDRPMTYLYHVSSHVPEKDLLRARLESARVMPDVFPQASPEARDKGLGNTDSIGNKLRNAGRKDERGLFHASGYICRLYEENVTLEDRK
ncbi:hypothetical protein C8R44DRAFT_736522 [Mycena epipterygia]|nr:hypothetical protein C8R44DRAFT_736522 [Mycena epipterygia]